MTEVSWRVVNINVVIYFASEQPLQTNASFMECFCWLMEGNLQKQLEHPALLQTSKQSNFFWKGQVTIVMKCFGVALCDGRY
jgi:hypothetical protein